MEIYTIQRPSLSLAAACAPSATWLHSREGVNVACYLFEETRANFLKRARGLPMDLRPALRDGRLTIEQIDPAEMPPGEFADLVRTSVERDGAQIVIGSIVLLVNGVAYAPKRSPLAVKRAIAAGNRLQGKPYKWGGGHRGWQDSASIPSSTCAAPVRSRRRKSPPREIAITAMA